VSGSPFASARRTHEASDAVAHLDLDLGVRKVRMCLDARVDRLGDLIVLVFHAILLGRGDDLQVIHDVHDAVHPADFGFRCPLRIRRGDHAEERHDAVVGIDVESRVSTSGVLSENESHDNSRLRGRAPTQIGRAPYASRCSSLKATIIWVGGRAPPGQNTRTPCGGSRSRGEARSIGRTSGFWSDNGIYDNSWLSGRAQRALQSRNLRSRNPICDLRKGAQT